MSQAYFKATRQGTYRGTLGRNLSFLVTLKSDHEVEIQVVGNDRLVRGLGDELVSLEKTTSRQPRLEPVNFSTRKVALEIHAKGDFVISPGSFFGINDTRLWVTVAIGKRPSTRKVVTIVLRYKNDPDPRLVIAKRK